MQIRTVLRGLRRLLATGALAWLPAFQVGLAADPIPAFTEVAAEAGLVCTHAGLEDTPGSQMHGGGTVGDFNGDGWPDLFMLGGGGAPDCLFINNGDGTFSEVAQSWGLTELHRGVGATAADYDRDGWMDLFVTSMGGAGEAAAPGGHRLYRNNGNGGFSEAAALAGVDTSAPEHPDGYGPTWGDYDLDGWLDLWVPGWHPAPLAAEGEISSPGNRLFRNLGDGTFVDVTESSGAMAFDTWGFGGTFVDMDGDRFPELLIPADFGTSRYFVNNRDGTFSRVDPLEPGADQVHNGMGNTQADFDRDGSPDWFVTAIYPSWNHMGPWGNRLYLNQGEHRLDNLPESGGIDNGGWGWGTTAIDFDHDGWPDIAMTNGFFGCDAITDTCYDVDPTLLFHNHGDGTFTDVAPAVGIDHTGQGRSLLHLDYDRDGDLDLAIFGHHEAARLYRNDLSGEGTHWIQVRLTTLDHPALAPHGIGSRVRIEAGGMVQTSWISAGTSYLGRSELLTHFGIGAATTVDVLEILWADGFRTRLTGLDADRIYPVAAHEPLTVDPIVPGAASDLTVKGLLPGETAAFGASLETGIGPCPPLLGGVCLDLIAPDLLGVAVANSQGIARLTVDWPAGLPVETLSAQVVVARGPGGSRSLKSNVVTAAVGASTADAARRSAD